MHSQDPNAAANRSLYAGFQHIAVISIPLARSKPNFHSGRSVPSVSRNSSEASSQYLKSARRNNHFPHAEAYFSLIFLKEKLQIFSTTCYFDLSRGPQ